MIRKAMREMAIINAATVLDKQQNSTGMFQLIDEVRFAHPEHTDFCNTLEFRLDAHRATFSRAVIYRSNMLAHRSRKLRASQVYEKASIDLKDLTDAIRVWLEVAQDLSLKMRGDIFWITYDFEQSGVQILKDLAALENLN